MSRYSSNLPRRPSGGRSMYSRTPASTSPERLKPPSMRSSPVAASAVRGHEEDRNSAPTASRTIVIAFMAVSSPGKGEARRVVGAVDVHVAVRARPAHDELQRSLVTPVRARRMSRLDVALLTEPRLGDLEHALVVRAVGIVAIRAALVDRRVHPQERPALVRVAVEARRIGRRLLQQRGGDRAVRVVAGRARHLAFAQRHVGAAQRLALLLGVALAAR